MKYTLMCVGLQKMGVAEVSPLQPKLLHETLPVKMAI
jgi:hypothetical protein